MSYSAMAVHRATLGGTVVTESAGVAGGAGTGYKFPNDGQTRVRVRNTDTNTPSVTFVTGGAKDGLALPDVTVQLAASQTKVFGPFKKENFDQPSGSDAGYVYIYFSGGNETDLMLSAEA